MKTHSIVIVYSLVASIFVFIFVWGGLSIATQNKTVKDIGVIVDRSIIYGKVVYFIDIDGKILQHKNRSYGMLDIQDNVLVEYWIDPIFKTKTITHVEYLSSNDLSFEAFCGDKGL